MTLHIEPSPSEEWVHRWPGIHKATEECGELIHVLSQLKAYPIAEHPGTQFGEKPLLFRLQDELGDVLAICVWFIVQHRDHIHVQTILDRFLYKFDLYEQWNALGDMQGIWSKFPPPEVPLNGVAPDKRNMAAANTLVRSIMSALGTDSPRAVPFEGEFGNMQSEDVP